jgi:phospholipid/cholesterol/gamma-HCH transport system ATP-binding protein
MGCALQIADRILVLDNGRILAHATPAQLKLSKTPLIQDFLSETLALLPQQPHLLALQEDRL